MGNVLLYLQQVFGPIIAMWPVWVTFTVILIVLKRLNRQKIFWIVGAFCFAVLLLTVFLRGIILYAYPTVHRSGDLAVDPTNQDPLYVIYENGTLQVSHTVGLQTFKYSFLDTSQGNYFEHSEYDGVRDGIQQHERAYLLRRRQLGNFLTMTKSSANISVPSVFIGKEYYIIHDVVAEIDLTDSNSPDTFIGAYISAVAIKLPATEGNKIISINGGSQITIKFEFPEQGPTFIIRDLQGTVTNLPSDFSETKKGEYIRKGSKQGEIRLDINVYTPKLLEVIQVNEHND